MGCGTPSKQGLEIGVEQTGPGGSQSNPFAKIFTGEACAVDTSLFGKLRSNGITLSDVWVQASFSLRLRSLFDEHPYLEAGFSVNPHPLQHWVSRCLESFNSKKYARAHTQLTRVRRGLNAELQPVANIFQRFDADTSGDLDAGEFRTMCNYFGWVEQESHILDLDNDGKLTLKDMQLFVGYLGGIQQLLECRRLLVTRCQGPLPDHFRLEVGAHVRSHFQVSGQRSGTWKDAIVQELDVPLQRPTGCSNQLRYGVRLDFQFSTSSRSIPWRTQQVVPKTWVLGRVDDAAEAFLLRQEGVLDDAQTSWAVSLPDSETHALRYLQSNQRGALALARTRSAELHAASFHRLRSRFQQLGLGENGLQAVDGWIRDLAPVVVHVNLDTCGHLFESDEFHWSPWETKAAADGGRRCADVDESNLFGGIYDDAKPFERVKYCSLNLMNDYRGVRQGESYLVLKDVRLRTTLLAGTAAPEKAKSLGTLDQHMHLLEDYSDEELRSLVDVAIAAVPGKTTPQKSDENHAEPQLLCGKSNDPTEAWVTLGVPGLARSSGAYYFEVHLHTGCSSPQVGLLSSRFVQLPSSATARGVGDDEHGWAVDGLRVSKWHNGRSHSWGLAWPCNGRPGQEVSPEAALSEPVVVGIAIDFDKREMRASTNGTWCDTAAFDRQEIPQGAALYPAVSLKGRAEFVFGPAFKHAPPSASVGKFTHWPNATGCIRLDCPVVGTSRSLRQHLQLHIHGELSLKRNVQRLVASRNYLDKPRTERSTPSFDCIQFGPFSGTYERSGGYANRPKYVRKENGASIFWDEAAALWRVGDIGNPSTCPFYALKADGKAAGEVPHCGWRVCDAWQGEVDTGVFKAALERSKLQATDCAQLIAALSSKDGKSVFRKAGDRSLVEEWRKLHEPSLSADELWDLAVEEMQQRLLKASGLPDGAQVVETAHPYEAKRCSWRREVHIKDAKGLMVRFASKSCTRDSRSCFRVFGGGQDRGCVGPGARVEVYASGGAVVTGTVVERVAAGESLRIRLDFHERQQLGEEATVSRRVAQDLWPEVGDIVEAKYMKSAWYRAEVVKAIPPDLDWYQGTRSPATYFIEWCDGNKEDNEKTICQLRRPLKPPQSNDRGLERLSRFSAVPDGLESCYALCLENPKAAVVVYGKSQRVGNEVGVFAYDRSYPLTPISVENFAAKGPAQAKGVREGWYLDLPATALGPSRPLFARLLKGLGGVEIDGKEGASDQQMEKLLDAAFSDLDELLHRLNSQLRESTGTTLVFTSSASSQPVKLLPEALVCYDQIRRVGSEIRLFKVDGKHVRPDGFLEGEPGPAQIAGVRTDWVLDVGRTRSQNPMKAGVLSDRAILANPNCLLAMSDLTLVFTLPTLQTSLMFQGSGVADPESWRCNDLPGCRAEFEFCTDGDSVGGALGQLWGVWALVLPKATTVPSRQKLDALSERWVAASAKAQGLREEPRVERAGWDEERLRSLCATHNWEFEWMTETGERRRLAQEKDVWSHESGAPLVIAEAADAAEALQAFRGCQDSCNGTVKTAEHDVLPSATGPSFTLMTFNVEEYFHNGQKSRASKKQTAFKNIEGIHKVLEEHLPDIICLQEHSLGLKGQFTEEDIVATLVGTLGYSHIVEPTGESRAWYSSLANSVLWKKDKFALIRSWGVSLATSQDLVPGTTRRLTPRSAAFAELKHHDTGKTVVICSTHLTGGRFEDENFVAEHLAGHNLRAEQVEQLALSIREKCGASKPCVIAGDFNTMNRGYEKGSHWRREAEEYYNKVVDKALRLALELAVGRTLTKEDFTFDGFFTCFQNRVHKVLDQKLGYVCAYGQADNAADLKTSAISGCIDWIYVRNLLSMKDECIVDTLAKGLSDHNAVKITLRFH